MNKLSNKTKGILCILFSALCFSGMSSFINLSGDVPVPQKVFFRNLVALFFASAPPLFMLFRQMAALWQRA